MRKFVNSIKIEVARRPRNGLLIRLAQRFLEPASQRVIAGLFGGYGLLEEGLPACRFVGQNPRRLVQLRLVGALGLGMRYDAAQVHVDDQRRTAAGTANLELALQLRHNVPMIPVAGFLGR